MFKLIMGEFKKILMRPPIFIMTGILALVISLSFIIYNPTPHSSEDAQLTITENDLSKIYDNFDNSTESYSRNNLDKIVNNIDAILNNYDEMRKKVENNGSYSIIDETFGQYYSINDDINAIITNASSIKDTSVTNEINERLSFIKSCSEKINTKISQFKSNLNKCLLQKEYSILFYAEDYNTIINSLDKINKVLNNFNGNTTSKTIDKVNKLITDLQNEGYEESGFKLNLFKNLTNTKIVTLDETVIKNLRENYIEKIRNVLNNQNDNIKSFYNEKKNISTGNQIAVVELKSMIEDYYQTCKLVSDIVLQKIQINIFKDFTDEQIGQLLINELNFERYSLTEKNVRLEFQFNQIINSKDSSLTPSQVMKYANPFSMESSSNDVVNGYDFMYFVMQIFSLVIILFSVVMVSTSIAGEQNNGTLKLLAIRPYKRWKIMLSKILSIIIFALFFLIFGSVIAFIGGACMYGLNSAPILVVFNATSAFTCQPIVLFLIFLLCTFAKIIVYISLAFAVATIFKTQTGATITSIICLLISILFNSFLGNNALYRFIPLNNLDLYKFFENSEIRANITGLFRSIILPDTNFYFGLTSIIITAIIFFTLTFYMFNRRDIA